MSTTFLSDKVETPIGAGSAKLSSTLKAGTYQAVVVAASQASNEVWVRTEVNGSHAEFAAVVAIELDFDLQIADEIVVSCSPNGEAFVLGVVRRAYPNRKVISLANGETLVVDQAASKIEIRDQSEKQSLAYDGLQKKLAVFAPTMNVTLQSTSDDLTMVAEKDLKLVGKRSVEVTSPQVLIQSENTELRGETYEAVFDQSRFVSRKFIWIGETLISTFRNAYQNIADRFQVRARRSRFLVEESSEVQAEEVRMRARGDVKVAGKNIHLG